MALPDQINFLNKELQNLRSEKDEMCKNFYEILRVIGEENAKRDSQISRIANILARLSRYSNNQLEN